MQRPPYDRAVGGAEPEQPLPIVGLGAGTHAKSVLEAIRSAGRFEVAELVDDDEARAGGDLLGFPIVGLTELERLLEDGVENAFVGVAGIADAKARKAVFERLVEAGFELPPIVHASAVVSPWAQLGRGAQVLAGAIVNAAAEVGDGAIVNTGAIVEHDCRIGAHAHVAPGARLAGLTSVGEGAHIGIGAVLIEDVEVGDDAFVGAGSGVLRAGPAGPRGVGGPARPLD